MTLKILSVHYTTERDMLYRVQRWRGHTLVYNRYVKADGFEITGGDARDGQHTVALFYKLVHKRVKILGVTVKIGKRKVPVLAVACARDESLEIDAPS